MRAPGLLTATISTDLVIASALIGEWSCDASMCSVTSAGCVSKRSEAAERLVPKSLLIREA